MNNSRKKIIAGITGLALTTAIILPLALPDHVSAKWFSWTSRSAKVQETELENANAEKLASEDWPSVIVYIDKDGESQEVSVANTSEGTLKTYEVDKKTAEKLQTDAEKGQQTWLLDPVQTIKAYADKYGFSAQKDTFTLVSQKHQGQHTGTGEADVLVQHGDKSYLVRLVQPMGSGASKIWQVSSIREVKTVIKNKPDVGPGVEGLDYTKIVAWQQAVDAGRDLWRLDPMKVAVNEGKAYGFSEKDTFTIIRKMSSTDLARHGQIDMEVIHDGIKYTMILVKPLGGPDAIWTIYRVSSGHKPEQKPPVTEKVLFKTEKYAGWDWHKGQYPKDIAFAVIADYNTQLENDKRIPEAVLEQVKDINYDKKVVLFAYLGGVPSGGYDIGIEKVTMSGNSMTVQVRTKSPRPGDMTTMDISSHADYITLDRSVVDIWGGVNITFVDQAGKVLSKNKIVISHRK
ncbi:protease complex subunit PrcB family protein [Dendrosporobacter sp. 1207_IL3150]|uniref:protease complex subunit PrcB family protein n=1 Tax=Dendrosporobacter sp. 1207_IL3150 TaxID=3084054 RepID=UPI002FD8C5EC